MSEEEEWTPTVKQWKRIKEMIEGLEETQAAPAPVTPQYPPGVRSPAQQAPAPSRPAGPNPIAAGNIRFPEVPVGDAPTLPDGPGTASSLSGVANPSAGNVQSTDEMPAAPPTSPGL